MPCTWYASGAGGTLIDPEGYKWTIATHKEDLTPQELKRRQDEWMRQFAPQPTRG
jgi:hypothetical protein